MTIQFLENKRTLFIFYYVLNFFLVLKFDSTYIYFFEMNML